MFSQASVILFTGGGGMCGRWGASMGGGMCGRGACMAGVMHDRGMCMAGGMHVGGHAWQVGCVWQGSMCGREACVAGAMHGRGACMTGGVHGQEVCMAGGRRDGHCSGRYTSYWNAFLLKYNSTMYTIYNLA